MIATTIIQLDPAWKAFAFLDIMAGASGGDSSAPTVFRPWARCESQSPKGPEAYPIFSARPAGA